VSRENSTAQCSEELPPSLPRSLAPSLTHLEIDVPEVVVARGEDGAQLDRVLDERQRL